MKVTLITPSGHIEDITINGEFRFTTRGKTTLILDTIDNRLVVYIDSEDGAVGFIRKEKHNDNSIQPR